LVLYLIAFLPLDQFYVLDVHRDELIFLTEPTLSVPERKENNGRFPTKIQPDIKPIQLKNYMKLLVDMDFSNEQIRENAKGWRSVKISNPEMIRINAKFFIVF